MKKVLFTSLFVLLLCSSGFSQWTFEGAWPDTNYKGGSHGIVVDPDGKVWTASYYRENWITPSNDTVLTSPIYVFNADGSLLKTIYTVTTGLVTDTLGGGAGTGGSSGCRGLNKDADGNMFYVSAVPGKIIKINYQTLEGMARHDIGSTELGSSPTKAAISSDGTVYVGPVVGGAGKFIATYDNSDLTYLGSAVDGPANIARTMEVAPDGLSIYWTMFTGAMGIDIYTRPDELSSFVLADSVFRGMSIETAAWNPATGNLWVSNDSRGTNKSYTHLTWYGLDVTTKTIVGSFTLPKDAAPADELPRGLAFSNDGMTAYVGLFGTKYDRIYKFTKSPSSVIFTDDFESGSANATWHNYYVLDTIPEDNVVGVPMANAPAALTGGGNYIGFLQDLNASYTGSAVAVGGPTTLANYSIEADVYCYVNNSGGSAYTGLVVYADSSKRDFYKLRADFDASNRINFSGLKSDTITFQPLFNKNFSGVDNPGLFPVTDGWHKMKVEVRATGVNETSFWCYFDGTLLAGCPIVDATPTRNTSGSFGLYTFQMDADGIPGYFDNIVINQLTPATSVEDYTNPSVPEDMYLSQNYPNPFNPTTNIVYNLRDAQNVSLIIYDILGEKVKTLVSQFQSPGQYTITWNGKNDLGSTVNTGIYIYSLKAGDVFVSKKMLMLK